MDTTNNGPQTLHGDYMIEADETSVHGVEESLTEVTAALCAAIDSEGLGAPIQEAASLAEAAGGKLGISFTTDETSSIDCRGREAH
jgi:hypothetical protein